MVKISFHNRWKRWIQFDEGLDIPGEYTRRFTLFTFQFRREKDYVNEFGLMINICNFEWWFIWEMK